MRSASDNPIRLVAIDLDGTLLDDSKRVSEPTRDAIIAATSRGVKVVIASARPPRSVRKIYQALSLNSWQINYNGALIWDEPNRVVVAHRPMEAGFVREMIDLARRTHDGVIVTCEILDRWCTDRFDKSFTTQTGLLFEPDLVAPLEEFCNQPISKLLLLGDPREILPLEGELLSRYTDRIVITRTEDDCLQICDVGVSKAAALRHVADAYGVSTREIMAIGDAMNDAGMIQLAGVGVAMANAPDSVKSIADWIAPSNNDDGVAAALQKFGLCA